MVTPVPGSHYALHLFMSLDIKVLYGEIIFWLCAYPQVWLNQSVWLAY